MKESKKQLPTTPVGTTTPLRQKMQMQKMASLSCSMMSVGLFKSQKVPKQNKHSSEMESKRAMRSTS